MSLRATVIFIVAIDAYGQAPQTAPPAPTKSASAQTPKGKDPAIRYVATTPLKSIPEGRFRPPDRIQPQTTGSQIATC